MAKDLKELIVINLPQGIKRLRGNFVYKRNFNPLRIIKRERLQKAWYHLCQNAYIPLAPLSADCYVTAEPLPFADRFFGKKIENIKIGDQWAKEVFDCAWFHITGTLPTGYQPDELVFLLDLGGEGLVYDVGGVEKQGITCYASNFSYEFGRPHKKVVIDRNLSSGGRVEFFVDAAANDLFGNLKDKAIIKELRVAKVNKNIRALAYDLEVLLSVYDHNGNTPFVGRVFSTLCGLLSDFKNITDARAAEIRTQLAPLLDTKNSEDVFSYTAIGHAHLDLAWLWPIRESYRKGARTFTNQLLNISRYPDYVFGASQAQLYEWVKERYPRIYANVKEAYKQGNWDVQGATWVEPDSNLISGESLVRQFFYGKQFFKREFDEDMNIFWVPDSFGYSACIPQVMKLAGVDYFLTQKMSWNRTNPFPYHTFYWTGLGGATVLAHMLPENTYNAPLRGDYLKFGHKNYKEKSISNTAMSLYGIGDGGGGPGFEHIERGMRLKDIEGMPKVRMEGSKAFFARLDNGTAYPSHSGELYLEKHQGTATTQSKNKYFNRKCEFLLRNYEILAAEAVIADIDLPISPDQLDTIWKEILLYQFHDILPGSSINRVYEESVVRYEAIFDRLTSAVKTLADKLMSGDLLNLNSFDYNKVIELGGNWYNASIPAFGTFKAAGNQPLDKFFAESGTNFIANDKLKVVFKDGFIVSVTDRKSGREYIQKGKSANRFCTYVDNGDCWDIHPINYEGTRKVLKAERLTTDNKGARAFAKAIYSFGKSKITQTVTLTDGSALIEFDTQIEFAENKTMLRVDFPLAVKSEEANFNVQFGHISRRTTHANSIERAQYEVSGQKFVDLSDGNCGVSLINDCKYGHKCWDSVLDLNLVRSPQGGPGRQVDHAKHTVRYALFIHEGALAVDTYREAYLFNNPLLAINGSGTLAQAASTSNDAIILETVKLAQNGTDAIVRLYNCTPTPQTATLTLAGYTPQSIVGIMENPLADFDGTVTLKPFELINISCKANA